MNKYQQELAFLRKHDEIQGQRPLTDSDGELIAGGYFFIETASHGYLVVDIDDVNVDKARKIASFGYKGREAIYLEEDSEAGEFLTAIGIN